MNHILIVDDEAEIRASLEEILSEEGYGVATAATAAEALLLLEDALYDVIFLDIWLPDRDGLDVLADIHAFAPERRPEVVIISGHGIRLSGEATLPRSHADRPEECRGSQAIALGESGVPAAIQCFVDPHRGKRAREGAASTDSSYGSHQWSSAHLR